MKQFTSREFIKIVGSQRKHLSKTESYELQRKSKIQ